MEIRNARPDDAEQLLTLIRRLAIHQGCGSQVKADADTLRQQIESGNKFFHCLVADKDGILQGFALFFYTYSTWEGKTSLYLEDLYVVPEAQGTGLGRRLIARVSQFAIETGCTRLDWNVIDTNKQAIDFYTKLGARELEGWRHWRFDSNNLVDLVFETNESSRNQSAVPISIPISI